MRDPHRVLIKPVVTEKAMALGSQLRSYTFEVDKRANKIEIRRAVEKNFNVKVESVNTIVMKGKRRRFRFSTGLSP
ncbi:MAG: 50S ribosomal protein L23, partial [Planctomycetota bacterium]|nr:50S ribosomal protein L23 [Planctomycetota bacterium]